MEARFSSLLAMWPILATLVRAGTTLVTTAIANRQPSSTEVMLVWMWSRVERDRSFANLTHN